MSDPAESVAIRPRRLRSQPQLRRLIRETAVSPAHLIAPLFVTGVPGRAGPIEGMPGCEVLTIDAAVQEARTLEAAGVSGVLLFGVVNTKDEAGTAAADPEGIVPDAIRAIKEATTDLSIWADVCLCGYTSHGHCGTVTRNDRGLLVVDNDATLPVLARVAVVYAGAGADVIAPSDMMDGRVRVIREALDEHGHSETAICSYAVKFASAFYGPFRGAAGSAPAEGDRRGYQLDPANAREALREATLDVCEGADLIMVKPALAYLDIVRQVRDRTNVPVVVYNVSGEYAMVKAAAQLGWIDETPVVQEMLLSMRRAGADAIVTYFAREAAAFLNAKR